LAPSRIRYRELHARFAQCCQAIEGEL
jgi:hypothetical protein